MRREVTITLVVETTTRFQDDQQVFRAINGLFNPLRKAIGNAFATIGAPVITANGIRVTVREATP